MDTHKARLICTRIANEAGLDLDEVMSRTRTAEIVETRKHCYRALRVELKLSYPQIADYFERDHSTIMFACKPEYAARKKALDLKRYRRKRAMTHPPTVRSACHRCFGPLIPHNSRMECPSCRTVYAMGV